MTHAELSRRTGFSEKHISQVVNGHVPLSTDLALALERALGIPAYVWSRLEFSYAAERRREERSAAAAQHADWLHRFPIGKLRQLGYLGARKTGRSVADRVETLLDFFGVTSPETWESEWARTERRLRIPDGLAPNRYLLAAWLRAGRTQIRMLRMQPLDRDGFRSVLRDALDRTEEPFDEAFDALAARCAEAGVALTRTPPPPKLGVAAATQWITPRAGWIALAQRTRSDARDWATLFTAARGLLAGRQKDVTLHAATRRAPARDVQARIEGWLREDVA